MCFLSITDCFSYAFIKPFWLFCSIWCYFSLRNAAALSFHKLCFERKPVLLCVRPSAFRKSSNLTSQSTEICFSKISLGFIKLFSSFVNDVKILNLIILWSLLPNFSPILSLDIILSSEENTRSKVLLPLVGLSTHCVKYSSLAKSNNRILSASAVCVFQLTEQLKSPATTVYYRVKGGLM